MLSFHVHSKNCEFTFARPWLWIKFGCKLYSTTPKMPQGLICPTTYRRKMVDENGRPLNLINCGMPSSSNHPGPMVLQCELDLFYDTLAVRMYLFYKVVDWMCTIEKKFHASNKCYIMSQHTKCIVFTNIIDLMLKLCATVIPMTINMSTIYHCTPIRCKTERISLND